MSEKYAVRNLRLCTKDCLCLYVCPTGATDTENSVIDPEKCIGCGACAEACPSAAISMVPKELPVQQPKEDKVVEALRGLIGSKAKAESIAAQLPDALSAAVEKSCRLMAEDLCREAGFMLPQSGNTRAFLESIKTVLGIPIEAVEDLLHTLKFNEKNEKTEEKKMEKWKCTVCGYIHEDPMTPDFKCPVCKQPAEKFVKIEDAASAKNPYAGTKTEKNLWEAFAGESQARNKYTYFASVAKKAGYAKAAQAGFFYRQCVADKTPESAGPLRYEIGLDTMKLMSEELPYPRISATYVCCLPGTLQYTSILLQYIANMRSYIYQENARKNETTWNIPPTFMPYILRGTLHQTRTEPR